MTRTRLDALIREQEGLDALTREGIRRIQLERLNLLLARERERGGFYAELPARLSRLEELAWLPFTTQEQLSEYAPSMLLCSQAEVQRVISDVTSGTTGAGKRVFYTYGDCERTVRLFMAGLGELVFPGEKTLICMPFSGAFGLGGLIAEAVERLGAEPVRAGAQLSYAELGALLHEYRPDSFVGMPVQLLSLLRVCGRGSLKRALVSADACPEGVMSAAEGLLGSKLFPHYGSREMGLGGAVCCPAHEGMHLRENHVIAEIIDENGSPVPDGEYGELVITTIGMEAIPLIRYRTGDLTRILPSPCPCGSELLRLDMVHRVTGSDMERLDSAIFADKSIADYTASYGGGVYTINALTVGEYDPTGLFKSVFGDNIRLSRRAVTGDDRAMYAGKRVLLTAENKGLNGG